MTAAGLELASDADLALAHALVERTVGPPLASLAVMRTIQTHNQSSLYVIREHGIITGVLGELPLTEAGLEALVSGAFDGVDPSLDHVAAPGDPIAAYYCWGLAAETRHASVVGVKGVVAARNVTYPEQPFFARAAEAKGSAAGGSNGARVGIRRFGCTYYPGQPTLLYSPKARSGGRSAA
jgi:hypothetical protein